MSPALRRATPDAYAELARIYDHYVATSTATFEVTPPGRGVWDAKLAALDEAGWPFLIAEVDEQVAGFAYVGPWRTRPAFVHTVEDTIYLAPAFIGRGIGTRLLSRLMDEAARAGAREVIAVVADGDTAASFALHERAGFVRAGRLDRVGHKFDRWVGTTLLQKSLTPTV